MIVDGEFFGHAVGNHRANGQAIVAHHLAEAIECRRFHLEVAHAPTLMVERLDFAVVFGIGQVHPQSAPLRAVKSRCRGGYALVIAFRQAVK